MAEKVSRPNASMALASACAKSPVSLVIPSDRVIRKDASLVKYG
ncbi:hypothetical protein E6H34_01705 [Candidatus Bathyarchaeota archaeon]|nr:MAG: hypothetical protein E6H34_01705 [Candidatus Bathyarchaeota archaeon]